MSDIDPTPETPVTLGDRLGWWRGDLNARIDILFEKLDTVITKLDGILTALTDASGNIDAAPIVNAITALRGTGGATLADIYDLFDPGAGIKPYALLDLQYTQLVSIVDLFEKSNNALGAYPNNSLELVTVRGLLNALLTASSQIGILPDGDLNDYLQSESTLSLNGRRYIVWPDLAGITESDDGTQLGPDSSWSGYSIYIQTTAPSATLHDVTSPGASITDFEVNTWIDLGGADTLAFSVESSYLVKGYLRAPEESGDVFISSQATVYNGTDNYYGMGNLINNSFEFANPIVGAQSETYSWSPPIAVNGPWAGWTLNIISGNNITIARRTASASTAIQDTIAVYSAGDTIIVGVGTLCIYIYSTAAFNIKATPPA